MAGAARTAFVALALAVLALAVRSPNLQTIPRITDEVAEVADALDILHGARPLVAGDTYRGPAWAYGLAGVFKLIGVAPTVPRSVAAMLGALLATATYLAGRQAAGERAGLASGLLTAAAFSLVTLNSHVAWSNNATPLWVMASIWATGRAIQNSSAAARGAPGNRQAGAFLLAGALWGVALQSHPSALLPLAGSLAWAARRLGAGGLTQASVWLGLAAFLTVLSPVIAYNLRHPLASVSEAVEPDQPVARTWSPSLVVARSSEMVAQLGRAAAAGPLPDEPAVDATPVSGSARAGLGAGLVLVIALAAAALRGPRRIGLPGVAGLVGLPLLSRAFTGFHDARYVAFLLPLGFVALAALADGPNALPHRRVRCLVWVAIACLAAWSLLSIRGFYRAETAAGRTNAPYLATVEQLGARGPILVDKQLRDIQTGGGGNAARALIYLLTLSNVPAQAADESEMRWFLDQRSAGLRLVVAPETGASLGNRARIIARWPEWTVLAASRNSQPDGGP